MSAGYKRLAAIADAMAGRASANGLQKASAAAVDAARKMREGELRAESCVDLIRGDALTPCPIRWLWSGWIARGKLMILAGAPGQGKTTIALSIAATVSRGGFWPDGTRCEPGNVLIWSGEDDPADTLVPRLIAMGADMSRIHFVGNATYRGERMPFDPARDMEALEHAAKVIGGASLLIVDPVVSAVAGDSHKNTEVRRSLQPLVDLATRLDCCALGISHFSKGGAGKDPTERVTGSVAFSAVARIVLVAAKVKGDDGEERRIFARSKSNIGPDGGGFEYSLEQVELQGHPGVIASRIVWGAAVNGAARELLAEPDDGLDPDGSTGSEVDGFLRGLLADGPLPAGQIKKDADGAGHSWRTVQWRAKRMNIERRKDGMRGGWVWALPPDDPPRKRNEGAETSTSKIIAPSASSFAPSVDVAPSETLTAHARRRNEKREGAEGATFEDVASSFAPSAGAEEF